MTKPNAYTILCVDDEFEILKALKRSLEDPEWRVLTTLDATEVIEIIRHEGVDVLISDVDMPLLSGTELVARVRKACPDVVRLMVTGSTSLRSAIDAINEGGVFQYIQKPWKSPELRASIKAATQRVDEIRAETARAALKTRRTAMSEGLESAWPGILQDGKVEGIRTLDAASLVALAERLGSASLSALLQPD